MKVALVKKNRPQVDPTTVRDLISTGPVKWICRSVEVTFRGVERTSEVCCRSCEMLFEHGADARECPPFCLPE